MNKTAYKFLKYEDVKESQLYTITLNPEDAFQFWDAENRVEEFVKHHTNYLKKIVVRELTNICQLKLHLEFSPQGRLHYHGTVEIYDKLKFYSYCLYKLKLHYVYEIDTIADLDVWKKYINKQNISPPIEIGFNFKKMIKIFHKAAMVGDH